LLRARSINRSAISWAAGCAIPFPFFASSPSKRRRNGDQAQTLADAGYRYLKIKLHGEIKEDVARVKAIRAHVGDPIHLTVDANQSYS